MTTTNQTNFGKLSISARRQTYPFEERLKMYSPENLAKQLEEKETAETKLIVGGVNLLNKRNMDTSVAIDRMKRRKEMHNRVERQRRDCLNQLMDELIDLVPHAASETRGKTQHRANGLRQTAQYIRELHQQNMRLRMENESLLREREFDRNRSQSRPASPVELPVSPAVSPSHSPSVSPSHSPSGSPPPAATQLEVVRPVARRYTGTEYPPSNRRYTPTDSIGEGWTEPKVENINACQYNGPPSSTNAYPSPSFAPFIHESFPQKVTHGRNTSDNIYQFAPYSHRTVHSTPVQ